MQLPVGTQMNVLHLIQDRLRTALTGLVSDVEPYAAMVKATTVPSLVCAVLGRAKVSAGAVSGQLALAQTSGSSLVATAPASAKARCPTRSRC